jgi:hypothetical protein
MVILNLNLDVAFIGRMLDADYLDYYSMPWGVA